jgi:hypothetical protein
LLAEEDDPWREAKPCRRRQRKMLNVSVPENGTGPHAEIGRRRISSTKWSTPEFWTQSEENDLAETIISD